jgi:MSHA pilin protein MshA
MKKKRGYTLIELVVVIVILGILAVIAAPRFINLSSDARASTVVGLEAAMRSGAELVHAKAVIHGADEGSVDDFQVSDNQTLHIRSGYPRVANNCTNFLGELPVWLDFEVSATCFSGSDTDAQWEGEVNANQFYFYPRGFDSINDNCYVIYTTASVNNNDGLGWVDADSAIITSATNGC